MINVAVCSYIYEKEAMQTGAVPEDLWVGWVHWRMSWPSYRDPRCCKLLRSEIRLKPLGYVNVTEA